MAKNDFNLLTQHRDLSIRHRAIMVEGRAVGLAVSLGHGFLFYTALDRLRDLDGKYFRGTKDILNAVHDTLDAPDREDRAA
jgi:hypothetical protein